MFGAKYLCTQCGHVGEPRWHTPGNILLELLCWLFFCLPGLLYSVWRASARKRVCAKCASINVIPMDSPNAKMILQYRSSGAVAMPPPQTPPQ